MIKNLVKVSLFALILAVAGTSCKQLSKLLVRSATEAVEGATGESSSDIDYDLANGIVGQQTSDFDKVLEEILSNAQLAKETVELSELSAYQGADYVTLDIDAVTSADKNKMSQYTWSSRTGHSSNEIILSDRDDNVINKYEDFQHSLFKLNDIQPILQKLPELLKQALEKSGYAEKGFVQSYRIDRDYKGNISMSITVCHKEARTLDKNYSVDALGNLSE